MTMALVLKKSLPLRRLLSFPSSATRDFYCPPASGKRTDDDVKSLFSEWATESGYEPSDVRFKQFRRALRRKDKDNARCPPPLERTEDECKAIFDTWILHKLKVYPSVVDKKNSFETFKRTIKRVDENRRTGDPMHVIPLGPFADRRPPPLNKPNLRNYPTR